MANHTTFSINKNEFKILSLVILLAICGALGLDIHLASLPYIMHDLHTNKHAMQNSISLYMLGSAISILIYGPLSDSIGRKPVVIIGLSIFAIASILTITTTSITIFLLLRFIQGTGSGVCWGLARIIGADTMQDERLAAIGSYFTLFISLSPLFAPVFGGYIQIWFNWQANFIILAAFIFMILLSFVYFFEETNTHRNTNAFKLKPIFINYLNLFKHRIFIGSVLLGGVSLAINIVYLTIGAFLFQDQFKVSPIMFGWLTTIIGTANILTKIISPFFIVRSKNYKIMRFGIILIWCSSIILIAAHLLKFNNIPVTLLGISIAMASLVLIGNTAMSMALSPFHKNRGSAGALYSAYQMFFAFVVSAVAASMKYSGTFVLAILYILLAVCAATLYRVFLHHNFKKEKD